MLKEKIKLDKSLFEFDMFWSIQNHDYVDIDKIIAVYCTTPTTHNIKQLVKLFGEERVLSVLERNKDSKLLHKDAIDSCKKIICNDPEYQNITAKNKAPFDI